MTSNIVAGRRAGSRLLALVILELTAATALIHFSLGSTIFLLNGLGYSALGLAYAAVVFGPAQLVSRVRWLPRLGLAAFALTTIGAYLVIGPYFSLGWATKAIEVAIVGLVLFDLLDIYGPADRVRTAGKPFADEIGGRGGSNA